MDDISDEDAPKATAPTPKLSKKQKTSNDASASSEAAQDPLCARGKIAWKHFIAPFMKLPVGDQRRSLLQGLAPVIEKFVIANPLKFSMMAVSLGVCIFDNMMLLG